MKWKPISEAATDKKQILVGFKSQFKWVFFVAPACGENTGHHMPHAKPTHWTEIDIPVVME